MPRLDKTPAFLTSAHGSLPVGYEQMEVNPEMQKDS